MSRKNRNARRNRNYKPLNVAVQPRPVQVPEARHYDCGENCDYQYTRLPASWLETDTSYQRAINEKAAAKIVENFDPRLVNALKVSHRDGRFFVFDGAHTLTALKRIHDGQDFEVDCKVFRGLTYEDEAYLFALQTGDSKAVAFNARVRALLISNNEKAVAFRESTERAGLALSTKNVASQNTIAALAKAYKLYTKYGAERYEAILTLIRETWGGAAWSLSSFVLGGVAELFDTYGNAFHPSRFTRKLSGIGYDKVHGESINYMRGSSDLAHAHVMVKYYNQGGGNGCLNPNMLTVKE